MEDIFIEPFFLNHSFSTKNADLHPLVIGWLIFVGSIVVSNALRYEAIVVWQQLVPWQLLPFITTAPNH